MRLSSQIEPVFSGCFDLFDPLDDTVVGNRRDRSYLIHRDVLDPGDVLFADPDRPPCTFPKEGALEAIRLGGAYDRVERGWRRATTRLAAVSLRELGLIG